MPAPREFRSQVEKERPYLVRYASLQLRDADAVQDAVQETLLAALAGEANFAGRSNLRTWLTGILKHKIADHFRRQAREAPLGDGDLREQPDPSAFDGSGHWTSGPTDWGGNPADLYREKKFLDQFTKCLADLSPNHANAFTLREIEGAGTGEICKVLNVTETNLWVILHRARMQLRRCLETHWFKKSTGKGS